MALPVFGANPDILFNLNDSGLRGSLTNHTIYITPSPTKTLKINGAWLVTADRLSAVTDSSGAATVTNVVPGNYQVDILGPWTLTPFLILVPDTNITLNVTGLVVSAISIPGANVAYTQSAADARFMRQATNYPGTAGQMAYNDGTGLPYWGDAPAAGAGAGASNAVTHINGMTNAQSWWAIGSAGLVPNITTNLGTNTINLPLWDATTTGILSSNHFPLLERKADIAGSNYVDQAQLAGSNFVDVASAQAITGLKTITAPILLNPTNYGVAMFAKGSASAPSIQFSNSPGTGIKLGFFETSLEFHVTNTSPVFTMGSSLNKSWKPFEVVGNITFGVSNLSNIGSATAPASNIFSGRLTYMVDGKELVLERPPTLASNLVIHPPTNGPSSTATNIAGAYLPDGSVQLFWVGDNAGAGGGDATAIHDDQSGEIAAITDKAVPVAADHLLIEDSAAADAKKDITIASLETALEAFLDLENLQGAVTDGQIPAAIERKTDLAGSNYVNRTELNGSNYVARLELAGSNYTSRAEIAGSNYLTTRVGVWRDIPMLASAWEASVTNGATLATNSTTGSAYITEPCWRFDDTITNTVHVGFIMPRAYGGGTVKLLLNTASATTGGTNTWEVKAKTVESDADRSAAWGTAVLVNQILSGTAQRLNQTNTAAITISGTPAGGKKIYIAISRLSGHANENGTTGAADLLSTSLLYQESSTEPAAP